MNRIIFFIIAFIVLIAASVPAFAVDWQVNPVFLRGVTKNTIYSNYGTTFGGGDFKSNSQVLDADPYGIVLEADTKNYNHDIYLGYMQLLSPERNFGIFISHNLGLSWADGTYYQNYLTHGNYYTESYDSRTRDYLIRTDIVYAQGLTDTVALGASFNFYYSNLEEKFSYNTLFTNIANGERNYENTTTKEKYYFGTTLGLAWLPMENLELDFAVEGGGFFGKRGYKESLINYSALGGTHNYDNDGNYSGLSFRTELDGRYEISDYLEVPFSVSYNYGRESEEYNGLGDYNYGADVYFKDYDRDLESNSLNIGAGINYSAKSGDGPSIFFWCFYKYDFGKYEVDSYTDERYAGFNLDSTITDTDYSNHTVGFSLGAKYPIMKNMSISGGVNYYYTFINFDKNETNFRNFAEMGSYDYSGDGYNQYLGINLGINYSWKDFNFGLSSAIPIINDSNSKLGGTNSFGFSTSDPIKYSEGRRDYNLILSITYSF